MILPPIRVQMSRRKGSRLPPNTIVVARPSRWGNWFKVTTPHEQTHGRYALGRDPIVVSLNRHGFRDGGHWAGFADTSEARAYAVDLYRRHLEATYLDVDGPIHRENYLGPLRGKNLACWCPLDQPCHADVLLEMANK